MRKFKGRIGEILCQLGIITPSQLEEALEKQKTEGGKLGEILISLGYVTEEVLLAFLGKQYGLVYVNISEYGEVPEDVLKIVPENIVRRRKVFPLKKDDKTLTVALCDPLDIFVIDDLKLLTGYDIKPVITSPQEIKNAIEKYYESKEKNLDEIVKEMNIPITEGIELIREESETISLEEGEEAPVIRLTNYIFSEAIRLGASDIHIEPYEKKLRLRYRIDGVLHEMPSPPKKLQNAIISRIKIMAQLDISEHRLPQDGRIKLKVFEREVDVRVSIMPSVFGEIVVLRLLDPSHLCLDMSLLGFSKNVLEIYKKKLESPYGIILVTGPTGSGKSTTLYSSLYNLNYPDKNIMTIEDPVEYMLVGINQVQVKPDIGLTFANGLRSFLRQDPDIIMVGEIRDKETAEIAINAALTGHLVFSTLHTNDAPSAMTRLEDMGIEPFLISSTILIVIAQRLVRKICEKCKEPYEISFDYLSSIGVKEEDVEDVNKIILFRGKGCSNCANTGYKGRIAAYELMEINDEIRNLIVSRAPSTEIKKVARQSGMKTLREDALRKMLDGITTVEEVLRVTMEDTE